MAHFAYTILYVADVQRSMDFYSNAFGLSPIFITDDATYGELNTGGTTLSFARHDLAGSNLPEGYTPSQPNHKPFGIEIGFTTSDVTATLQKAIEAGGKLVAAPKTKPWGQTVAYVQDPDAFLVEVCTAMK